MSISKPPIGYLSSLLIVVMDASWGTAEVAATTTIAGIPLIALMMAGNFIFCGAGVTLLEKFTNSAEWGEAIAKGFFAGVIAGVPYPVVGPIIGTSALGWNGLYTLFGDKDTKEIPSKTGN